jgi:hypothetical protein
LAGETEVLGENLPQCRFAHNKPYMLPGSGPGPPRWEFEAKLLMIVLINLTLTISAFSLNGINQLDFLVFPIRYKLICFKY